MQSSSTPREPKRSARMVQQIILGENEQERRMKMKYINVWMTFIDVDGCLFRLNSAQTTTKCKLIRYTMMSTNVTKRKEKNERIHTCRKEAEHYGVCNACFLRPGTNCTLSSFLRDSSIFGSVSIFFSGTWISYFHGSIEEPHIMCVLYGNYRVSVCFGWKRDEKLQNCFLFDKLN